MEIQTGIEPLQTQQDKQLLKQFERCKRLPVGHWQQAASAVNRLKTHLSFLTKANNHMNKYNIKDYPQQPFFIERDSFQHSEF